MLRGLTRRGAPQVFDVHDIQERNRRRVSYLLIGLGVLLALGAGGVTFVLAREAESALARQPTVWTAVAAVHIPERSAITREQVTVAQLPENAVPPEALFSRSEPGATEDQIRQSLVTKAAGQFTPQAIYKGEVINSARLSDKVERVTPSYLIPPGKVWYHFPVRVGGGNPPNDRVLITFLNAVRPGDFVDIYYTSLEAPSSPQRANPAPTDQLRTLYTRRIMQNILVVNVGPFPVGIDTTRDDRYLTLEVTPDQALTLKWVKDAATITGNIEFLLRSPRDTQVYPAGTIDFDTVSQQTGIGTGAGR